MTLSKSIYDEDLFVVVTREDENAGGFNILLLLLLLLLITLPLYNPDTCDLDILLLPPLLLT